LFIHFIHLQLFLTRVWSIFIHLQLFWTSVLSIVYPFYPFTVHLQLFRRRVLPILSIYNYFEQVFYPFKKSILSIYNYFEQVFRSCVCVSCKSVYLFIF
jgi:hypothetical protein